MTYPTPEEIKQIAIECNAHVPSKGYGSVIEFTPEELQAFVKYWMNVQRESDAKLLERNWNFCAEAIRNNTGE